MNNIMIVFPYKVTNKLQFNDIINKFDKQNYYVHIFDELDNYDFNIDVLPEIVTNIKKQYKNINKIVILSNIKEIIFSWYRCYNSLIDDYIFFIDNEDKTILKENDLNKTFIKELVDFTGIENEPLEGKVYINIDFKNYKRLFSFLLQNKFKYFEDVKNIDYFNSIKKRKIEKKYYFNGNIFYFNYEDKYEKEKINLIKNNNNSVKIDNKFIDELKENIYFIPYLTLEIYEENSYNADLFLENLYISLKNIDINKKKELISYFDKYFNSNKSDIFIKMFVLQLMLDTDSENELILMDIKKSLSNNDVVYANQILSKIKNSNNFNTKVYKKYFSNLEKEICEANGKKPNSKKCKIAILKGESQYNVLRVFCDRLEKELLTMEHEVYMIDGLKSDWYIKMHEIENNGCDFIFSFNAMEIDCFSNQDFKIPVITCLVDHPIAHDGRINTDLKDTLYILTDKDNFSYMKKYYPDKKASFLPLNGYENNSKRIVNYDEFEKRDIDILFAGTLIEPKLIKESWKKYNYSTEKFMNKVTNILLSENICNISQKIVEELKISNIKLDENREEKDFVCAVFNEVEYYIRQYRRKTLLKTLADSSIKVECFGNVNEYSKINTRNTLNINENVSFEKLLYLMSKSKMVLNISGHASNGVSERVLSTMINGAVSITDSNKFILDNFNDKENILIYDKNKIKEVPNIVNYYLSNVDELKVISKNGVEKVKAQFSIRNFAKRIIEIFAENY